MLNVKIFIFIFVHCVACCCNAIGDTNVIAQGEWSEPVSNDYGKALRGRLLLCSYPDHRGGPTNREDVAVYLELQEYSDAGAGTLCVYCDFAKGLKLQVADSAQKPPEPVGIGFSGGEPTPQWVLLPTYSSVRLRTTVFGGGKLREGGLGLWFPNGGGWTIKSTDTNTYFLSGTFSTIAPMTNTNRFEHTQVWNGTLKLPKIELPKFNRP